MGTTWIPRQPDEAPRQWLLANGDVVDEPRLEETTTGQKVRIAGSNHSVYAREEDNLVLNTVEKMAARRSTRIWMPLADLRIGQARELGYTPEDKTAELYLLKKQVHEQTNVWWRFKHPTLPIEAVLHINAGRAHRWPTDSDHRVTTGLVMPLQQRVATLASASCLERDEALSRQVGALGGQCSEGVAQFIRATPPSTWDPTILGRQEFPHESEMAEALLSKIHQCDQIQTLQIPDLRNPDKPAWLDLELTDTNLNSRITSELTEYLEGAPSLAEALRLFTELRECLRGIGIVMEGRTDSDFHRGLLGDDPEGVTVPLARPHAEDGVADDQHSLRMHLPTGTFIVDCSVNLDLSKLADHAEVVAGRWDEARTIAALSGEEDTLLAFARGVSRQDHSKRARKIIRDRTNTAS